MDKKFLKKPGRALLVMAALGLAAAGSPPTALYFARPETLPEWAEQGRFRFIRLDGGAIESEKAERTFWGRDFSAQEKELLAGVYDRHLESLLGLISAAEFNWIWVTWSNGWSLEKEAENRRLLAEVIRRCHERGIKVTAYLSATNMFWLNTIKDEPESWKWGLSYLGVPVFYAGFTEKGLDIAWQRRIADVRNPQWRAYVVKKAELAVAAGADALFFDNIIGDSEAFKLLISEVQHMAEEKARALGRPKPLVYANVHLTSYRFDVNDHCDLVWDEPGKNTPGVWEGKWEVGNARKIKFLRGEKQPWQPLKYEYDVYHCGPRERCIPSPAEQKLAMAEAQAFGAALSRNIEGRFLAGLLLGETPALAAWEAIARYNRFFAEHADLYHRMVSPARLALLSREENNPAADAFIKESAVFETKVLAHLDKGVPLRSFSILFVPFPLPRLEQKPKKLLAEFLDGGGTIYSPEPELLARKLGRKNGKDILPLPDDFFPRTIRSGGSLAPFLESLADAAGGPLVRLDPSSSAAAVLWKKDTENFYVLHLLNYDLERPVVDLKVEFEPGKGGGDLNGFSVNIFSPDEEIGELTDLVRQGGRWRFTLSRLPHYAVVTFAGGFRREENLGH